MGIAAAGVSGPWTLTSPASLVAVGIATLSLAPLYALYTRLARHRLLDHPTRAQLLGQVRLHPGANCGELARDVGVSYTTAERHLRTLVRFGFLASVRTPSGPRFFDATQPSHDPHRTLLLRRHENRAFLHAAAREPHATLSTLGATLGISKSTASRRAAILRSAGLLEGGPGAWTVHEPGARQAVQAATGPGAP
jgi:DNA-binding MarR family transcriptional regulator